MHNRNKKKPIKQNKIIEKLYYTHYFMFKFSKKGIYIIVVITYYIVLIYLNTHPNNEDKPQQTKTKKHIQDKRDEIHT